MALVESELIMDELLKERRKDRWFRILRTTGWMIFIFIVLSMFTGGNSDQSIDDDSLGGKYAAVVELDGTILPGSQGASLKGLSKALKNAFSSTNSKGVVLRVNSPGGSPVQSDLIRQEINRLKAKYDKRLIVVGEEMLTSGAYMVSMSADQIYANPATLVGSIGVRMDGFGFTEVMKKVGVERRTYSAGENKIGLDPFMAEDQSDVTHTNEMLREIHAQFISMVMDGRGDRLGDNPDLFSGLYWTGEKAVELGLIDGTATLHDAIKKEFGVERFKVFEPKVDIWSKVNKFVSSASTLVTAVTDTHSSVMAEPAQ